MNKNRQLLIEMGIRISKCRKELQMTQEQLAEAIDLSLQSISCIELKKRGQTGKSAPALSMSRRLRRLYPQGRTVSKTDGRYIS